MEITYHARRAGKSYLQKQIKEINDDNLFLSEDFILNIDIRLSIMEIEELENKNCMNCSYVNVVESINQDDIIVSIGLKCKKNIVRNYRPECFSCNEWKIQIY